MTLTVDVIRSIVEQLPEGILVLKGSDLVYANPALLTIFGYSSKEEIPADKFVDVILPAVITFLKNEKDHLPFQVEMIGFRRDGTTIDVDVRMVPLETSDATVLLLIRDITEKKIEERQQALFLKEQEALSVIDRTLLGETNLDTLLHVITEQTVSLLQADWAAIVLYDSKTETAQWKAVVGGKTEFPLEPFSVEGLWHSVVHSKELQLCDSSHTSALCALQGIRKLVDEEIVSLALVPLRTETEAKGALLVGYRQEKEFSGRDIRLLLSMAEKNSLAMLNAQLYADLYQREAEMEKLAGVRVQAQEEERRKIAREIHDGLGQLLTAIKFNLEILEDALQVSGEQKERIDDMKRLLDNVMQAARELSYNLMPSVLDDFGVVPALQVYCDQVAQRYGYTVTFQAHGISERLPAEWEVGLYRIVQESLMMLQKLGTIRETEVQLLKLPHYIRLTVEAETDENGKNSFSRIGDDIDIVSIRERASLLGGTLSLDTSGERSVLLCVEIPCPTPELQHK